jgi:serine/threonine protein kinase
MLNTFNTPTRHVHAPLQEFCDLGTLREYAVQRLGLPARLKLGEPEAMARLLQLLHDSATGLAALHAAKVVHGDLVSRSCSGTVHHHVTH